MKALSLTLFILTLTTATQSVNASSFPDSKPFSRQVKCNGSACADKSIWNQSYNACELRAIIQCAQTASAKNIMTQEQKEEMIKVDPSFYKSLLKSLHNPSPNAVPLGSNDNSFQNASSNGVPYPGRQQPSAWAQPKPNQPTNNARQGEKKAKLALAEEEKRWDFTNVPKAYADAIKENLEKYAKGDIGQDIKNLQLRGRTPEQIHDDLQRAGFNHSRIALQVSGNPQEGYWLRDGKKTMNPKDPNVVPMDIYYKGQQVVRVKPEGIPDKENINPQPQACKSISKHLVNPKDPHTAPTWDNELFKVTEAGVAVPKGLSPKYGFVALHSDAEIEVANNETKQRLKEENGAYADHIMQQVHLPISTPLNDNAAPSSGAQDH